MDAFWLDWLDLNQHLSGSRGADRVFNKLQSKNGRGLIYRLPVGLLLGGRLPLKTRHRDLHPCRAHKVIKLQSPPREFD